MKKMSDNSFMHKINYSKLAHKQNEKMKKRKFSINNKNFQVR